MLESSLSMIVLKKYIYIQSSYSDENEELYLDFLCNVDFLMKCFYHVPFAYKLNWTFH